MKIDPVSSVAPRDTPSPIARETRAVDAHGTSRSARVSPQDRALAHAASEMEAVFVRHLLEAAKIGGSQSSASGYGSMAVDALAAGIETGGGIGLARRIEEALAPPHPPPAPPSAKSLRAGGPTPG